MGINSTWGFSMMNTVCVHGDQSAVVLIKINMVNDILAPWVIQIDSEILVALVEDGDWFRGFNPTLGGIILEQSEICIDFDL